MYLPEKQQIHTFYARNNIKERSIFSFFIRNNDALPNKMLFNIKFHDFQILLDDLQN